MATVFRAEDLKHHRSVAIKLLRREVALAVGPARFRQEIEVVAPLHHPHILPLYDSDELLVEHPGFGEGPRTFLYYIMPIVEGGTLQDRLVNGPPPGIPEVLALGRQVASGLGYAHAQGLVHRDIKPANLLLSTGHVFIGDFGIARMLRQAVTTAEHLTDTNMAVGTPAYMAPEQIHGGADIDGRADQYSLACVLFEMLVGRLPSAVAHGSDTLLHTMRKAHPELPGSAAHAILRALSDNRDHRFESMAAFATALESQLVIRPADLVPAFLRRAPAWVRWTAGIGGVAAGVAATWLLVLPGVNSCPSVATADTTRYAVFPFAYQTAVSRVGEEQLLADGISRWGGVEAVDQFQLREALARGGQDLEHLASARELACKVGVRRFILGNVGAVGGGDSLRIFARLYDLGPGEAPLSRASLRVAASMAGADSLFGILADSLLFRSNPPQGGVARAGTRLLPARQAFDSGQRALVAWNLAGADSAFRVAVALDARYPAANLWLALVRIWRGREPALWFPAAQQAAAGAAELPSSDSLMAQAALAMGSGELQRACPLWRTVTVADPRRFAAWYGLSDCLRADSIVVRDAASPSGWRFRSSYHEAQRAYLQAIRLLPSILAAPGNDVATLSDNLLYLADNRHRKGQAARPDTASFVAAPSWRGDSLVFIPYPRSLGTEVLGPPGAQNEEAIRRQRLLLDTLALTWATEAPTSVEARLALVEAMALAIDPAAIDSARGARRLAHAPGQVVRVIDAEVRTLLQFGVPDRTDFLDRARSLADSVLETLALRAAADPTVLTTLAALTGRARLAAEAARRSAAEPDWDLPKPLLEAAPGLLMYAAMGGPADSVRALWRLTESAIQQALPPDRRPDRIMEDLGRPVTLAFPAETLPSLAELRGMGDWLLTLQAELARGNGAAVQRWADSTSRITPPKLRTFDTTWPVAGLLLAAGDSTYSVAQLDANLASVRFRTFGSFGNPVEVATMIRTMILRAELARRTGDPGQARRWSRAVIALWGGADRTFQPELEWMRAEAR